MCMFYSKHVRVFPETRTYFWKFTYVFLRKVKVKEL